MNDNAPIIIFSYRREINKLIKSLLKNKEAKSSDLFIFSDGFKSQIDKQDVLNVRISLKKIIGFKSTKIFESKKNNGLSSSIIKGVKLIINNFGKAIILEDDLIVSKYFLQYMNKSLNIFQDRKDIWSISGYGPPLPCLKNYSHEVYLSCRTSSWGWATWKDRWNKTNWSMEFFKNFKKNKKLIKQFEQGGDDLFKMLELNFLKKINSWDILWCYNQFINNAYSVFPKFSMSKNKGFNDGFETHTSGDAPKWDVRLASCKINSFNTSLNKEIMMCFKKYHDLSFYTKIGYFLKKFGGYEIAKKLKKII
jgi:hypothetical protein